MVGFVDAAIRSGWKPGQAQLPNRCCAHDVMETLARHGVDVVFGQSIPSMMFLVGHQFGIRQITYRTENAGAAMADGYARISGRIGVVTAQNGPAATLLVAGLAEAYEASIPVLALVQDVRRTSADKNAFQEIDHLELFKGCTKQIKRVTEAATLVDYIDRAIVTATSGRPGPVVVMLPMDLLAETTEGESNRLLELGRYPLDRPVADPETIERAAELLATAASPVVIAGGGIHISGACAELAKVRDRLSVPVGTTNMGKGAVADDHPLSIGVVGNMMGNRSRTQFQRHWIDDADVIVLIGTRTNENGTDAWSLIPPGCKVIHLDIDPEEIGRNYEALRLAGDACSTLAALDTRLADHDLAHRLQIRADIETKISCSREQFQQQSRDVRTSSQRPIRPERLMSDLDTLLLPDDIVVADASFSSNCILNYLSCRRSGQRFLTPRIFCLVGDGAFAHVWSELETAKRLGVSLVVTVLNNQILGFQLLAETARWGSHTEACYFEPVDHAAIARACGVNGVTIEDPDDYLPAVKAALAEPAVTLIDVATDPKAYLPISVFDGKLPV